MPGRPYGQQVQTECLDIRTEPTAARGTDNLLLPPYAVHFIVSRRSREAGPTAERVAGAESKMPP